jgi:hypothetical protein
MEEMREIKRPAEAAPETDDVWERSRQGSAVPPLAETTFFYSRKQRLERAPASVRKLHEPDSSANQGRVFHVFGRFSRYPSNRPLFLSLLVLCLFIGFISLAVNQMETKNLGGNEIGAKARRQNGATFITITKTFPEKRTGQVYTGEVALAVGPSPGPKRLIRRNPFAEKEVFVDENHPIVTEELVFSLLPEEVYELILPYEAPVFLLLMQTSDEERITMRLRPRRSFF